MSSAEKFPGQARHVAGMQTARLSDGETAYCVHGERGPWVVLVHGLVTPSFAWKAMADMLVAEGFRVLRYDQFGRGLSDRPHVQYDVALYVRQLRELTAALGIDAMHLVGWSMGGLIVTRLAHESPERVRSLTLIAPALFLRSVALRLVSFLPGSRRLIASRAGALIDGMEALHFSRPERFPTYVAQVREQMAWSGFSESLASTLVNFSTGAGDDLRGVGNHPWPVLVVWGEEDTVTPYANAAQVIRLFPRAALVTVTGARHAPHLDHAEEVFPVITRHLHESETGLVPA